MWKNVRAAFGPSGGILYHYYASRFQKRLWGGFKVPLHRWLMEWQPDTDRLILVGPSAGYCLNSEFLDRFKTVVAVELDPIAKWQFSRLHAVPELTWDATDYFLLNQKELSTQGFKRLLDLYPGYAVLFCNILGQLPLMYFRHAKEGTFDRWIQDLITQLDGRAWASFHDRLSGPIRPSLLELDRRFEGSQSNQQLIDQLYQYDSDGDVELTDHCTSSFLSTGERRYFSWEIYPGQFQLVEGLRNEV